jgi:hypothetical protein
MSPAGARDRLDVNIKQKSFRAASGGKLQVLGELSFSLGSGQVAALVGPSGCGKTTLLRIVAGLDRDFDGGVALPAHGTLGMVFQEPRLLLDEPFVSLDDALAARLHEELAELVNRRPVTTLLVTHNVDEAAPTGCCCSRSAPRASLPRFRSRARARRTRPRSSQPCATRSRGGSISRFPRQISDGRCWSNLLPAESINRLCAGQSIPSPFLKLSARHVLLPISGLGARR